MDISVVIPAFNEEKLLPTTLEAVRKAAASFTENGSTWELIVCDNNSSDGTAAVAAEAGARVVFEGVNQIGRARNTGAAMAVGRWIIFIDADSQPSRGLMDDVLREMRSGKTLAGGSTVRLDDGPLPARLLVGAWNSISQLRGYFAGSFIFTETQAFRDVGGFSPDLYASEEIELAKRLHRLAKKRGQRIRILDAHPLITSSRKLRLYSNREHLELLRRVILTRGGALRSAKDCHFWYDGRR